MRNEKDHSLAVNRASKTATVFTTYSHIKQPDQVSQLKGDKPLSCDRETGNAPSILFTSSLIFRLSGT